MPASMTRKHFEALAAAIKKSREDVLGNAAGHQWLECAASVADVCARFNPNFDRARFLTACGAKEN